MRNDRFLAIGIAAFSAIVIAVLFSAQFTAPTVAQSACYRGGGGTLWVAGSGCEWETQAGSTLDVQGALQLGAQTETVTATFIITPTSPYIVISSDAAYTSSTTVPIATTGIGTGQIIAIRNGNASDALIIDGVGGSVECKANVSLAASDTLTLIFNGTDWNCLSGYDNS